MLLESTTRPVDFCFVNMVTLRRFTIFQTNNIKHDQIWRFKVNFLKFLLNLIFYLLIYLDEE